MWTITENEYYLYNIKTRTGRWIVEYQFWKGDLTNVDFINDWRFCVVNKLRMQVKLLGTKDSISFPIQYPLVLDNGIDLNGHEKIKYDEER